MMPAFAANLTMLWSELDVYDRFVAAAQAGFKRVEILFVHDLDARRIRSLTDRHELELVLFDPYPGDWGAGERGLLSLPGREQEFQRSLDEALETAARLGTRKLNTLAGILPAGVSRERAEALAIANLQRAAPQAQAAGVNLLVEAINSVDMPGYVADTVHRAAAIVNGVNHPSVRLQLDQY